MDPEAWARATRERLLAEVAARVAALEAAPAGRIVATRTAEARLRRLLTTLRDDVPPELLGRARAVLGEGRPEVRRKRAGKR